MGQWTPPPAPPRRCLRGCGFQARCGSVHRQALARCCQGTRELSVLPLAIDRRAKARSSSSVRSPRSARPLRVEHKRTWQHEPRRRSRQAGEGHALKLVVPALKVRGGEHMRFESADRARAVVQRSVDDLEVFRLMAPSVADDLVVLALELVALGISDGCGRRPISDGCGRRPISADGCSSADGCGRRASADGFGRRPIAEALEDVKSYTGADACAGHARRRRAQHRAGRGGANSADAG